MFVDVDIDVDVIDVVHLENNSLEIWFAVYFWPN